MPELPEVETLRSALIPLVRNQTLIELKFLRADLRFPIPAKQLKKELTGLPVHDVTRVSWYERTRDPILIPDTGRKTHARHLSFRARHLPAFHRPA
jgi:formamidopyrimidine-DNA glycosylase